MCFMFAFLMMAAMSGGKSRGNARYGNLYQYNTTWGGKRR